MSIKFYIFGYILNFKIDIIKPILLKFITNNVFEIMF
jgi:hypothetical protein